VTVAVTVAVAVAVTVALAVWQLQQCDSGSATVTVWQCGSA
jgi:cytochrome oxidase assembly protein ShyY1